MKKLITTSLLFTLLLSPSVVLAEENEFELKNTIRERIENKIESVKDGMMNRERQENQEEKRLEIRNRVAQVHANRLQHRFNVYYQRLSKIILKIEERLKNLQSEGKDITMAQAKLNEAKTKLEEAKKYADESVSTFTSIIPNEENGQKEVALEGRDLAEKARELFKEVLRLIKEAVRISKSL